jgi:hypothetical protein
MRNRRWKRIVMNREEMRRRVSKVEDSEGPFYRYWYDRKIPANILNVFVIIWEGMGSSLGRMILGKGLLEGYLGRHCAKYYL